MVGKGFIASGQRILHQNLNASKNWYFIDANEQVTGRLASQIAKLLIGKHKPTFDPSVVCGDNVVVTNARKIVLTRNQWKRKLYRWHTGYPGGLREMPAWRMRENFPERVLEKAVWGMLPKNKLRYHRFKLLRVYADAEHEHYAQENKAAPLPPHFKLHEKPVEEKLDIDDDLAHLREYYVVKMQHTEKAIKADAVYIPSVKEEKKKEKQIRRYINRRPTLIEDLPNFGEYVVDAHNAPLERPYGFKDVSIVAEEAQENHAKGIDVPSPDRKEFNEELLLKEYKKNIADIEKEIEENKEDEDKQKKE